MRFLSWGVPAISPLGAQTYGLMKNLWHVTAEFSEQLWQETVTRRNERVNHGERDDLRRQWTECKRRLGTTGRNSKHKLVPSWALASQSPMYKIKAQLAQWLKVRIRRVAPN